MLVVEAGAAQRAVVDAEADGGIRDCEDGVDGGAVVDKKRVSVRGENGAGVVGGVGLDDVGFGAVGDGPVGEINWGVGGVVEFDPFGGAFRCDGVVHDFVDEDGAGVCG